MLSNEKIRYTDEEILEKGSGLLIKELGYSGFLRYIGKIDSRGRDDYLKIEQDIFKDMSIDDIYEKAKKHWENRGDASRGSSRQG